MAVSCVGAASENMWLGLTEVRNSMSLIRSYPVFYGASYKDVAPTELRLVVKKPSCPRIASRLLPSSNLRAAIGFAFRVSFAETSVSEKSKTLSGGVAHR
jgi:hypothetical protein